MSYSLKYSSRPSGDSEAARSPTLRSDSGAKLEPRSGDRRRNGETPRSGDAQRNGDTLRHSGGWLMARGPREPAHTYTHTHTLENAYSERNRSVGGASEKEYTRCDEPAPGPFSDGFIIWSRRLVLLWWWKRRGSEIRRYSAATNESVGVKYMV